VKRAVDGTLLKEKNQISGEDAISVKKDGGSDWSGIYRQAVQQEGLKVPYREVGPHYGVEEIKAVIEVIQGDIYTQGPFLKLFQEEFADYMGARYAFGVSSCTGALEMATQILEIGKGDEVIVPAITFIATVIPLLRVGAKVVFTDLDPLTYTLSADTIAAKITYRTRAIYVVHMNGLPADMDPNVELAKERRLKLVEDCAHSAGAVYRGRKTGTFGDFGCFSFHTVKNITNLGEGGVLTTNDEQYAKLVPLSRWVGIEPYEDQEKYWLPFLYDIKRVKGGVPYNFCMSDVQANVGRVQLRKLEWMNARRNEIAARMSRGLQGVGEITVPRIPEDRTHAFHLFPVLYDGSGAGANRDDFVDILYHEFGVKSIPHYLPPYQFSIFQEMGYPRELCQEAERIYSRLTNTPMNLSVIDAQADYMVESIRVMVEKLRRGDKKPKIRFAWPRLLRCGGGLSNAPTMLRRGQWRYVSDEKPADAEPLQGARGGRAGADPRGHPGPAGKYRGPVSLRRRARGVSKRGSQDRRRENRLFFPRCSGAVHALRTHVLHEVPAGAGQAPARSSGGRKRALRHRVDHRVRARPGRKVPAGDGAGHRPFRAALRCHAPP
jgi:perosamine synthetase